MMAAGVVHGVKVDQVINSMNYGNDLQFMFYYVMHCLAGSLAMDGHAVLLFMNWTGTLLALSIPFLLFFLIRSDNTSSRVSPSLAALLLISSPVYAFIVPYGHPFHAAIALSLFSMIVFRRFASALEFSRRFLLLVAAVLLQAVALTIRAEQVFLFWFCVVGLFIYEQERSLERWLWLIVVFASSALIFAAMHNFMVTAVRDTYDIASPAPTTFRLWDVIQRYYGLIRSIYTAANFPRSIAYHITDIGIPLLGMAGFFLGKQLSEKQYRPVLALIISVGPSFLVYLVNTSPPRHFAITVIGLAIYVGASARSIESHKLIPLGVTVAAMNLLVPLILSLVDPGGVDGQRRNYTYSFYERSNRNKVQTKTAMQFFQALLSKVPTQTVIFGEWIHIAQMSMLMSGKPRGKFASGKIAASVKALVFTYEGRKIYLVEAYDDAAVRRAVAMAGELQSKFHFLSLLPGSTVNDLGIVVPREIGWWSV
jgi:hypothetical protein